ncbi:MAG: cyclase [Acidobacteria bacterium]|nr:cyclase [Acidobacteriota bacterium]
MAQRATVSIMVNATPETVYRVITDFSNYVNWVSELKRIDVLEHDAEGRPVSVQFRAAAFGRSTTYVLRYDYSRAPEQLSWFQTSGDITSSLKGQYVLQAVGSGTKVTYDLEVELLVPIPNFIKSRAAHRIQTQALDELKTKAESVA